MGFIRYSVLVCIHNTGYPIVRAETFWNEKAKTSGFAKLSPYIYLLVWNKYRLPIHILYVRESEATKLVYMTM